MRRLSTLLSLCFIKASLAASTFFVSPGGSDENNGTEQNPWRTIQHAANHATPGSTVVIRKGTYKEHISVNVGGNEEEGKITFIPYQNEKVSINGSFAIHDKNHLRIEGFEINEGIQLSGKGDRIDLLNNVIHDGKGISVDGSLSHVRIHGNEIYDCKKGLSLGGSVEYFVISQNYIHDVKQAGIELSRDTNQGICKLNRIMRVNGNGIEVDGGHHFMVSQNEIGRCDVGIAMKTKAVEEVVLLKNELHDNHKAGIALIDGPHHNTITKNKLIRNDASKQRNGEIFIQSSNDNQFIENSLRPNNQNLIINASRGHNQMNQNSYFSDKESSIWIWDGIEHVGFQEFQEETGQESQSSFY